MSEKNPKAPDREKSPEPDPKKELTDEDLKEISGGAGVPPINADLDAGARKL